ncbi:MAG: 4Fe-4S double cluster binding domain-containing protein [Negativicutes bacterium]|nr:4Fe-4S double cluster binding domain-containing protein [Negativicutes bacterium]
MIEIIQQMVQQYGGFMAVADLRDVNVSLREEHQTYFRDFTRGIAIGMPLIRSMTNLVAYHQDPGLTHAFDNHYLAQISPHLENLSLSVGLRLQEQGYKSFVMVARGRSYKEPPYVLINNVMIGWLAGIGYMGKSGLLIHEKYGPRFRLNVVLTDAPLEPVGKPVKIEGFCENCTKCVEACPSKAITGQKFDWNSPDKKINRAENCGKYRDHRGKTLNSRICNVCQYVCPAGTL